MKLPSAERTCTELAKLCDYWESGMDLGLSRHRFGSFLQYQALIQKRFMRLQAVYGFAMIDGNQLVADINLELKRNIEAVLAGTK